LGGVVDVGGGIGGRRVVGRVPLTGGLAFWGWWGGGFFCMHKKRGPDRKMVQEQKTPGSKVTDRVG